MQVNDYVRVKKTGKVGQVSLIGEQRVGVFFEDKEAFYKPESLEFIEPIHLTESDLRNIFRMNTSFLELLDERGLAPNYTFDKPYQPTVDDLLSLLANIKISQMTVGRFLTGLYEVNMILKECYLPQSKKSEAQLDGILLTVEGDLFDYILSIFDVGEMDEFDIIDEYFDVDDCMKIVSLFKKNNGKPLLEREYTESIKENYIVAIQDEDLIDSLEKPYADLFVKFVSELADGGNGIALEALGYCYYGGNKLFECNWAKSRDIFERICDKWSNPQVANSLGYIYYDGRSNNGQPDYEKAFKYFSIGAAAGIYESKYKQADMFNHGYGVKRNPQIAEEIYFDLYQENLKIFSKGFFDCKLADIAVRIGDMYAEIKEYPAAYFFYLQADFAIRKRMENFNYYGDMSVFDRVNEGLENCRRNVGFEPVKHSTMDNLDIIKLFFEDGHSVRFTIKQLKGSKRKITDKRIAKHNEYTPYCLLTYVSFGGCQLTDEFSCVATNAEDNNYLASFKANSIDYQYNVVNFYDDDQLVYSLDCEGFRVDNPILDNKADEHRLVRVRVEDKTVDYLCNDIYVTSGDSVVVLQDNKKTIGTVIRSFVRKEKDLEKPISKYSNIEYKTEN